VYDLQQLCLHPQSAARWLVHPADRGYGPVCRFGEFFGQLHALRFTAGERYRDLAQLNVAQNPHLPMLQLSGGSAENVFEYRQDIGHRRLEQIRR